MRITYAALVAGLTLLLGGCFSDSASDSANPGGGGAPPPAPPAPNLSAFRVLYVPGGGIVPTPNDIFFSGTTDGTLNLPATPFNPLVSSLNALDGYSTTATLTARFSQTIDASTVEPFNVLAPSPTANLFIVNVTTGIPLIPNAQFTVGLEQTVTSGGATLEIRPTVPLAAKSTYAIILTNGIRNLQGQRARADAAFDAIRDAHFGGLPLTDPLLESIRVQAVGPLLDAAVGLLGLAPESIVVAWSASTQSISDVLDVLDAGTVAQTAVVNPVPSATTGAIIGPASPNLAFLHNATLEVPYYLSSSAPLTTHWNGVGGSELTRFNPAPVATEVLTIPMLVSVPMGAAPMSGWPVVIYQHGITANRATLVALADAFAAAGFAAVAIDIPLHGIRPTEALNPVFGAGALEPHFGLDVFIDTGAGAGSPGSDGIVDNSAFLFINLSNPLTLRDNLRQGVANLIALGRTVPTLDFTGDGVADTDATRVHFMGWSLGGMIGTGYLAVNTDAFAGSLFAPGGRLTSLILESQSFGPLIIGLLESQGLQQGTALFNEFLRNIQTIVDSGDPVNYAAAAGQAHPIHMLEVLGDATVPNTATDLLAAVMGLPARDADAFDAGGVSGIVRLTEGDHSTIALPNASLAAFLEAQTQTSTFIGSNGTLIDITNGAIVQPVP